MPVFQVVVQEKEQHPLVLGSASAHSVINAPVPGAQAGLPGTERFLHTQAPTHPITTGIITASALGGGTTVRIKLEAKNCLEPKHWQ